MKKKLSKNSSAITILILIIILGLIIRIWGISFSLPYIYHVDEENLSKISIRYFSGDLNPHFFHVPSLHSYVVAGIWGVYFLLGKVFGKFHTLAEFINYFNTNPTIFFILGRIFSVLLSIGTILIVYLIGKKMFNPRVGLLASLFLIFSPEHNKISHYSVPDVPMVFFLVLSFFFIWLIYLKGKREYYILAGLFAGLCMATKYGGHLLFIPLFLAHLFHILENKQPIRNIFFSFKLILSVFFFLAGFFIGCPYAIFDSSTFWRDFNWQAKHLYSLGHYGSSTAQPAWLFYLWHGFKENIGKYSQYLVFGGIIYGLFRHKKREIILFSFPLLLFLIIGSWKTMATRYFLPLVPFLALIGANFLDIILSKIAAFLSKLSSKLALLINRKEVLTWLIVIFFISSPGLKVIKFNYSLTQKDTRTIAKRWIEINIPKGTKIALEMYCPPISRRNYKVIYKHSLSQIDLEWLSKRKVNYIIVSDIMYSRFTRFPTEFPKQANFYNSLEKKAVLIKCFEPKWDEYLIDLHNPTIKIYRLSNYSNFSFPGNFTHYSQNITLTISNEEEWTLQSTITGEGLIKENEIVKNPYVRIVDSNGKEIVKLIVYEGEIRSSGSFSYSNSINFSPLLAESKVYIGYEYYIHPSSLKSVLRYNFRKEYCLSEKIEQFSLLKKKLYYTFLYTSFPKKHGDDYFQIVTLSKLKTTWTLFSSIFGGELRWGDNYVLNPFVQVTDFEGNEIVKLLIFKGKVGSKEANIIAPAEKSIEFPFLPYHYKVYVGYDYYIDFEFPDLAGGPEKFEIRTPSLLKD